MLPLYIQDFLSRCAFPKGMLLDTQKLPNDASRREYYRGITQDGSVIIADCTQEPGSLRKFINCRDIFALAHLRVPEVICNDQDTGLAIIEDFGNTLLNHCIDEQNQVRYYKVLLDMLTKLQAAPPAQSLQKYDAELLDKELMQFVEHYLQYVIEPAKFATASNELMRIFRNLYPLLNGCGEVIVHRDFHLDNLMLLENDEIGVIDFQDAVMGSAAYDVVSLLHDARRFVPQGLEEEMLHYFLSINRYDPLQFMVEYNILSLQKSFKIIGIFHRIYRTQHRIEYYKRCDIVWKYVARVIHQLPVVQQWFRKYGLKFINALK